LLGNQCDEETGDGKFAYTGLLYGLRSSEWRANAGDGGVIFGFIYEARGLRVQLSIEPPIAQESASTRHTLSLRSSLVADSPGPTPIQLSELVLQLDRVLAS
jgi:hypothetical protein